MPAFAGEYFGAFGPGPSGEFRQGDRWQELVLDSEFAFEDPNGLMWVTPEGIAVNGASIPPIFWSLIGGPFSGLYLKASVIHDHYVVTQERTSHDTHRNFYYGMCANGVPPWKANTMYWAVRTFGKHWILEAESPVGDPLGWNVTLARARSELREAHVEIARQSLLEVARTQKTSGGQILRITLDGAIESTLEGLDADADLTRRILALTIPELNSENVIPAQTIMQATSGLQDNIELTLENLPVWPEGVIPLTEGVQSDAFLEIFGR
ncbi:MAG: DUF1353 domain-containing protein [Pseudomonadota bacterium]